MGRVLAVLLILVIAVGAMGFYLNWWQLNRTSHGDEVDITLKVDKNKIKKDTGAAIDQVQQAGRNVREKAEDLLGRETVRGKVATVDADKGMLVVARDKGESVTLQTNATTTIKRNDETISLRDVQPDQPVMAVFSTEDGTHLARSITVETK